MQIVPQLEGIEHANVHSYHYMICRVESLYDGGVLGQRKICSCEYECEARDLGFGFVDDDFLSIEESSALGVCWVLLGDEGPVEVVHGGGAGGGKDEVQADLSTYLSVIDDSFDYCLGMTGNSQVRYVESWGSSLAPLLSPHEI